MKPFNLEEALTGKSVLLRNGDEAYIRHFEPELMVIEESRVVGYSEGGLLLSWSPEGRYNPELRELHHWDIVGMYPEIRLINGFEVPAPETEELKYDTRYYIASLEARHFYNCATWDDHDMDKLWLERGLVFLCAKDAVANTKAMLGIDPNTGEEE